MHRLLGRKASVAPKPLMVAVATPNATATPMVRHGPSFKNKPAPPRPATDTMTAADAITTIPEARAAEAKPYHHTKFDIWMLGITIVIGGQYFSWNAGLSAGLYSYLICYFLVGSGYFVFCCCISEVTGALPFAGGAYGLSRCTLGFFLGYLVGCCETLEYMIYVSTSVVALAGMIIEVMPALQGWDPLIWLLFFASAVVIQIRGNRTFWVFNLAIGAMSIGIVLLYCFGSLPAVNFKEHTTFDPPMLFVGGVSGFLHAFPLAAWFFVGVEALTLASDQVAEPKATIPHAQIACIATLFTTGMGVLFVAVSLPPGLVDLIPDMVPFNYGLQSLIPGMTSQTATIFSLPATYATAFGFIWCYGKLIAAMATSRLLPPVLSRVCGYGTPHVAIVAGSAASYLPCLVVWKVPALGSYLFSMCMFFAFLCYIGQCVGYIRLRRNFANIQSSTFRSPFGVAGAVYAITIWSIGLVAIIGFQGNNGIEVGMCCVILVLLTAFYYAYARKRQIFSAQENKILLVAHITKFNANKLHSKHTKQSHQTPSGRSGRDDDSTGARVTRAGNRWSQRSQRSAGRTAKATAVKPIKSSHTSRGRQVSTRSTGRGDDGSQNNNTPKSLVAQIKG